MAEIFTPLSQINKDRIDWKIQVRICRKWRTPSIGRIPESLDFLFVDHQGLRIHASVKKMHIAKFESKVNEGDLCTVMQFSVADRHKNFPIADCPYRIWFHATTIVGLHENPSFPKSIFNFCDFQDISDVAIKDDYPLIDIIGKVVDVNDSRMISDGTYKGIKSIHILLEDSSNQRLKCVLWEPYCHEFKNYIDASTSLKDSQVIILQLCRAKEFKGKVSISNTYNATRVIVDQNCEEIIEFKNKLPTSTVSNSFDGSKLSSSSYISVKDELLNDSTIISTIKELKAADSPVKIWLVASIAEVIPEFGWSYIGCQKCKKKVKEEDNKFFCDACKKHVVAVERFKIHMNVVDGSSNATFLLWNEVAKSIIGKNPLEVWETLELEEANNNGHDEAFVKDNSKFQMPQPIEDLIRKYLFKVGVENKHIQGYDKVYVVEKYCADEEMIKTYRKTNHEILSSSSTHHNDVMDETNFVQTPEFPKTRKRFLEVSSKDGEFSSSEKENKSARSFLS